MITTVHGINDSVIDFALTSVSDVLLLLILLFAVELHTCIPRRMFFRKYVPYSGSGFLMETSKLLY